MRDYQKYTVTCPIDLPDLKTVNIELISYSESVQSEYVLEFKSPFTDATPTVTIIKQDSLGQKQISYATVRHRKTRGGG